jgi:hypothetical protein
LSSVIHTDIEGIKMATNTTHPEVEANHYLDQQAQVNGDHDQSRSAEGHESKDTTTGPSSPVADEKPQGSETDTDSYHEVERNIGVTKIEALYIVFGKGWKLAMLWLYVLYGFSVFSCTD